MSKTALIEAVRYLDLAETRRLLAKRPELRDVTDQSGRTLLHIACTANTKRLFMKPAAQVRFVKALLDAGLGADIDTPVGKDKCTALFFAVARARNPSVVKLLLSRGAEVRAAPGSGLFGAVWYGDLAILRILVEAGAEVDNVAFGMTPFLAAWCWSKFPCAKYLVAHGADVNFQDLKGRTALRQSVDREFDPALLKWLVARGASPDINASDGVSARLRASRKRDKRFVLAFEGPAWGTA